MDEILAALDWQTVISAESKVVIKLNLNTADPETIRGANTSPLLVETLCRTIKRRTPKVVLVESHGYRYSAEHAFDVSGIYELAERTGVEVVNLSHCTCRDVIPSQLGPLPEIALDADVFVTMPVIKTHALTYFTGALKNQWGCIPRYDRIALHSQLDWLLVELHRVLRPQLCIMDGMTGIEGRGPTNGTPRRLDIVLGSADAVALDATAMRLVGLNPARARHVVMAHEAGLGSFNAESIELDADVDHSWQPFEPARLDWAVSLMNRLSRYGWFRSHILEVTPVFNTGKRTVNALRKLRIVR
ncbi:MAG: DUF362 domain-containing protein [Acidobacteria bacterium]|nr:DUF362 domain-containing protein [Acidobacteriota bacterium]